MSVENPLENKDEDEVPIPEDDEFFKKEVPKKERGLNWKRS